MTKKDLNQNAKFNQQFIDTLEPDFLFDNKPINRFKTPQNINNVSLGNKVKNLSDLKKKLVQFKIVI